MGPPTRAPEVRVALVARSDGRRRPGAGKARRGPARAKRAWVTAQGWGLREVELAGLSLHKGSVEVWLEAGRRKSRLHLPFTEMDQGGKGSPRTWSCVCDWGPLPDGGVLLGEARLRPACCVYDQVHERLEALGQRLQQGVEEVLCDENLPVRMVRVGSLFWFSFDQGEPPRRADQISPSCAEPYAKFFHACLQRGVHLAPSAYEVGFLSTAHTEEDIDHAVDVFTASLREALA